MGINIYAFTYFYMNLGFVWCAVMAGMSRAWLHVKNMIFFFMFCVVFLALRKFCQPYDNFGEERNVKFIWPIR
jgi:hypothetical protein